MTPDPRPPARVRDAALMRTLHLRWRECALCGATGPRSLHHIHRHPRDDVQANLVMLCGDGTRGCHGQVEARDHATCTALGTLILLKRPDTMDYLTAKLGGRVQAEQWILTNLYAAD